MVLANPNNVFPVLPQATPRLCRTCASCLVRSWSLPPLITPSSCGTSVAPAASVGHTHLFTPLAPMHPCTNAPMHCHVTACTAMLQYALPCYSMHTCTAMHPCTHALPCYSMHCHVTVCTAMLQYALPC